MSKNVRITKCYLVEYVDDDGKELCYDYCFGTKEEAVKVGEKLKNDYVAMESCDCVALGA